MLFLGSSCIYPKLAAQPMREEALLTGPLEPTNEPHAIAKIAGIKLCESYNRQYGQSHGIDYRSVMPTLIRKFHLAKLAMEQDWPAIEQDAKKHGHIPEELLVQFRGHKNQGPDLGQRHAQTRIPLRR